MIPNNDLNNYLSPSFHTIFGPKLYYGKTFLNVNIGIGVHLGKTEYFHDTLWNGMANLVAGIELGRAIDFGEKFSISPLIGIRKLWNFNPPHRGFGSQFPLSYGFEMNFGRNVNKKPLNSLSPYIASGRVRSGYHLKFLYQNPRYDHLIPELNGGLFTIAFGTNFALFKRKYPSKE